MLDLLATSAIFAWLAPGGRCRNAPPDEGPPPLPALAQPAPPAPKKSLAALPPTARLDDGGRSPYLLLDPATAADRFLDWLDQARVRTATADEAWLLYGEHCLDEGLEQLPNNVIMAEVGKRVWRGQKRMNGERPTVYAFDQPPVKPKRKLTLVERRRMGLCHRPPAELRAA